MAYKKIHDLLKSDRVVVLDGGFGTELRRRQVAGIDDPHIWSARGLLCAPTQVIGIHRDYIMAGADIVTAGAFRTNERALRKAGMDHLARSLTHFAVSLAREMRPVFAQSWDYAVAGNATSVEDCYTPDISPGFSSLSEHRQKAEHLAEAGADLILFESISHIDEARAALSACEGIKLPIWLALVLSPGHHSAKEPMLLDGTPVRAISQRLKAANRQPEVLLFNCCEPEIVKPALKLLLKSFDGRVGAYANVEREYEIGKPWRRRADMTTVRYTELVKEWIDVGARVVGGCCGTGPEDVRAIRELVGWAPRPRR